MCLYMGGSTRQICVQRERDRLNENAREQSKNLLCFIFASSIIIIIYDSGTKQTLFFHMN